MIVETKMIGKTELKETHLKVNGKTRARRLASKDLDIVQMTHFDHDWKRNWGSS